MAGMVLQKPWDATAKSLAGVAALNVGLIEFVNFNVLEFTKVFNSSADTGPNSFSFTLIK